ncbi:MAG: alpha/beta hydrolase [Desertimonas sp.]
MTSTPPSETTTRRAVNDVELDVIEAGDPSDPAIMLLHGFPESAHSWRHQIEPLAAAGFHVLAPDQRGYARSSAPTDVTAYRVDHLAGDVVGLLDATGHATATVVGHDWGALLLWDLCRLHPDRVDAAIGVSVPYTPWPAPPTELFKAANGDRFFYILYFQDVGPAEAELGADPAETMRLTLWAASAARAGRSLQSELPAAGNGFLDSMRAGWDVPEGLPAWITAEEFAVYADQFGHSGFFGPVSWYRNLDADHELTKDRPFPNIPTAFIGGTADPVTARSPGYIESMDALLPDHRASIVLDGVGHWTQQEDSVGFTAALMDSLRAIDRLPRR